MAEMTKEAVDYIERSCQKYRRATVGIEGEHTQCISDLEDLITSHRLLSNERDRLKRERDYFENKSACRGLEADLEEIDRLRAKLSQAQATIEMLRNDVAMLRDESSRRQISYNELIMAVGKKYPYEDRHATALRYIRAAEQRGCSPACVATEAQRAIEGAGVKHVCGSQGFGRSLEDRCEACSKDGEK